MNANLTAPQLRDLAREAGIPGRSRMRKAELIEALAQARRGDASLARLVADRQAAGEPSLALPEGSSVRAAIAARNAYLEVAGDPVAAGAAWEDYLDACDTAGVCAQTYCWENATDGDGRCGHHSHGAPLGENVVSRETAADDLRRALRAGADLTPALAQLQRLADVRRGWALSGMDELRRAVASGHRGAIDSCLARLTRDLA